MATKAERIQKSRDYVARCKSNGVKFQLMWCPHCRHEMPTRIPDEGDYHDSMAECPACLGLFHYTSRRNGVTIHVPGLRNMSNIEVMRHLMEGPCDHPMQQVFIISALLKFCEGVAEAPPGYMEGNMVSEELWRGLAKKVSDTLNQYPMVKVDDDEAD